MTLTVAQFLIVCPLALLAGFVDSIAGGGGKRARTRIPDFRDAFPARGGQMGFVKRKAVRHEDIMQFHG